MAIDSFLNKALNANDSYLRHAIMAKTLSFASLHFTVAFSLGWLLTGSWLVGGALALIEPACNTVVFHFHEKFWKRREARRGSIAHV
ncbi:MAG: DUF2061 domain-containing protein [Thermomonas sp.]|jgi:uncharacterized membrane protein|uniref:DUF2061 domain-containing protein n=1 Tax=Thermomonas sp. TaxID=1971895 RepID=UPI001EB4A524|nr:DUF2061 domain-containing protein [Thermomonas sp.]MBV2208792.1 DUF2061 domain-containing protein [Thermomonas sp.]